MRRAHQIPMTFNMAFALAAFATLRLDIFIKCIDWKIRKIEHLGLMRKRQTRLAEIAEADWDLQELEREMRGMEQLLEHRRKQVCDSILEKTELELE
jgi:hypothetical protein